MSDDVEEHARSRSEHRFGVGACIVATATTRSRRSALGRVGERLGQRCVSTRRRSYGPHAPTACGRRTGGERAALAADAGRTVATPDPGARVVRSSRLQLSVEVERVPVAAGETAAATPPIGLLDAARSLGEFLAALHVAAPSNAPINPFRGIPLALRTDRLHAAVATLGGIIDGSAVVSLWDTLVAAPACTTAVWVHGDLHPANILVNAGKISGVIDFGDITSGDRATDLAVAWMLFPFAARSVFREAAGASDEATWARSRAWAIALSLAYLVGSADNPMMHQIGTRTLAAALDSD